MILPQPFSLQHYDELDSSQSFASRQFASFPHGTVISADKQTAGYGRFSRPWLSGAEDDLYITVIWKKETDLRLTQKAALALCLALEKQGALCDIKWPNDILCGGKKIAGILAEKISGQTGALIGIGVNVNKSAESLSQAGQPAISLALLTGKSADRWQILHDFLVCFEEYLENKTADFHLQFNSRLLWKNQAVLVSGGEWQGEAVFHSVGADGRLNLDTNEGRKIISSGELKLKK